MLPVSDAHIPIKGLGAEKRTKIHARVTARMAELVSYRDLTIFVYLFQMPTYPSRGQV